MKNRYFRLLFTVSLLFSIIAEAQDSPGTRRVRRNADSSRSAYDSSRRLYDSSGRRLDSAGRRSDTSRFRGGRGMSALFADSSKLGSSDYQAAIERSYATLTLIKEESELGDGIRRIRRKLNDADSSISVMKDNILSNSAALNLRNLELYKTLLNSMREDIERQRVELDSNDQQLNRLRRSMKTLMEDTVLRDLMRDSATRASFSPQLKEMRTAWRAGTGQLKESLAIINQLQTHNSRNAINTTSLLHKVDDLLSNSFSRLLSKERSYIWSPASNAELKDLRTAYRRVYTGEQKALRYYFRDSVNNRLFLLLIGAVFLTWIYRNVRSLRNAGVTGTLEALSIDYLFPYFIASSLILIFILAPLFDLHAPAVYIESMQFLLILTLTYICWRKWPRKLFYYWLVMVFLFICFSFTHHTVLPGLTQRLWLISLNVLSIVFGSMFLRGMENKLPLTPFLRFVIILHNIMNALAIVCNIAGRLSLAQILGNAAIFSFTQAIGLAVFSKICAEAILLQVEGSRSRQGVKASYQTQGILESFRNPILVLVVVLWLIVFATNLNLFTAASEQFIGFMRQDRKIGSAVFTFGGVLLFFGIIWIAHLLQKYVGYFFGDTGEEDLQNKRQRSKMLIARLVVLCFGYLLAVAASGLPVDKITIVLGALGVGIGLGLQNIVSNFVSGIILIFDRPLQIGDSIEIGTKAGKVREIGLRSSTLLTAEGAEVIIPNGDILSQQITNWTLSNNLQRIGLSLTIKGETDLVSLDNNLTEILKRSGHWAENTTHQLLFKSVKDDTVSLVFYFWCSNAFQSEQAASKVLEGLQTAYADKITATLV